MHAARAFPKAALGQDALIRQQQGLQGRAAQARHEHVQGGLAAAAARFGRHCFGGACLNGHVTTLTSLRLSARMATHTCATWGAAETSCSRGRHGAGVSRQSRPVHRPRCALPPSA